MLGVNGEPWNTSAEWTSCVWARFLLASIWWLGYWCLIHIWDSPHSMPIGMLRGVPIGNKDCPNWELVPLWGSGAFGSKWYFIFSKFGGDGSDLHDPLLEVLFLVRNLTRSLDFSPLSFKYCFNSVSYLT